MVRLHTHYEQSAVNTRHALWTRNALLHGLLHHCGFGWITHATQRRSTNIFLNLEVQIGPPGTQHDKNCTPDQMLCRSLRQSTSTPTILFMSHRPGWECNDPCSCSSDCDIGMGKSDSDARQHVRIRLVCQFLNGK